MHIKSHTTPAPFTPRSALACALVALSLGLTSCAQNSNGSQGPQASIGPGTLNVADAAIAGGDPEMALSVSQSILANDPGNVDALVHEGNAYYALDRCPPAEAAFQLALKGDPKSSVAETGLGRCMLKVDPRAAETAFMAAASDDPGNAAALNDLGIARDLQGNFAGAVAPYQNALLADPSLTAAEINLGLSLALSGQGAEALQYLGPLATGPNATPKMREDYAAALVATGRQDEARQVLAIDLPPDQVNQAMAGFQALIANSVNNPPPPPQAAPTQNIVQTQPVNIVPPPPAPAAPVITPAALQPVAAPKPLVQAVSPKPNVTAPAPAPVVAANSQPMATKTIVTKTQTTTSTQPVPLPVSLVNKPAVLPLAGPAAQAAPKPLPVQAMAAPAHIEAQPLPLATDQANPASAVTGPEVQLAALNSAEAAHAAWVQAYSDAPSLLGGKAPQISKVTVNGRTFYRLRVGGFSSKSDAAAFCSQFAADGGTCTVANF